MNSERRKAERAPANLLVYFGHADANHLGFAQDISSTGVRLRARKAYPAGTKLFLKVEVPGEGMVPARGVVQRARRIRPGLPSNEPSEMGILIIQENPHLKDLVDDLLHTFENNRHGRRTEHEVRVSLANSTGLIAEYTQNIGDGGIFVVSEVPREKGATMPASLFLPNPFGTVTAQSEVVHVISVDEATAHGRLPGCGIRFQSFEDNGQKRYDDFLRSLRKEG